MRTKKVIVLEYDDKWKENFNRIKKELEAVLKKLPISIEHVGSTSVVGLAAKPIIDIDIIIKNNSDLEEAIKRLSTIGYIHEGNLGIKNREAFRYEGKEHLQVHHIYVCPENSEELKRHIIFRDYLRKNLDAVEYYSRVKKEGANLYPNNIEKYIEYKSLCISELYKKCGLE
ncbi:MAG: GrpB family protein [Velocimicrobium sp.]